MEDKNPRAQRRGAGGGAEEFGSLVTPLPEVQKNTAPVLSNKM